MNDPVSAYNWLKRGEAEFLNYTLNGLITRMQAEAEAGNFSAALTRMQQLETASQAADRLDQARIRLERALAACQMHDPSLAAQQLETALELLGPGADRSSVYAHTYAVANWILGLLTMPLSSPALTAATAWQNSLGAFEYLATEPGLTGSVQGWYLDRRAEMLQAIDAALDGRMAGPALQQATLQPGRLASIAVFGQLSIARFGRPGLPPGPAGQLPLQPSQDEFRIAGLLYHLFGLRGPSRLLALDSARQYCALQVSGDWMNRVEVDPEDYVLLRFQEEAESGDIVAVEVFNAYPSAMVYHLLMNKDAITLRPQSTNPAHQTFEFGSDEGDRYHVYGVVLGVFKPSAHGPPPPPEEQAAPEQEVEGAPIPVEDFLQTFRIYSDIPAGGPQAAPTFTGRHVELDRFIIADRPYTIKNLRRSGRRINPRSGNLIILRVSGDSMNDPEKANIQDGDYVLLLRQNSADDGDIVAAEIRGEDTLATLKRYRVRNSRIALVPESTNPEHQEREFSRPQPGEPAAEQPFHIQGIALAVFKPYP